MNILLVDDQQAKLLSHEVVLAGIGENLFKASSAREAFECLLKNEIGLILIDVCMPELDGFELAAMIREHPRFQSTAIIFVSAVNFAHLDQLRGYQLGAVDYVPVPVVPELLRAKVKVFVDLYRKTRQLERFNAELEARVLERTAELRRFNEELEQRIEERTRERETALAQLFEAQKMDTIGQLTGGVAHDFNNLLMAVLGSLTLLEKRLPEDPQCRRLAAERRAGRAARRGAHAAPAGLLAPPGAQARGGGPRRAGQRDGGAPEARAGARDRAQVHLPRGASAGAGRCQSARAGAPQPRAERPRRDAGRRQSSRSPRWGRASAESGAGSDSRLPPGEYLRISIVDTGIGMDEQTLAKATDPFFTTKGPGKGTGLGLSMVHGSGRPVGRTAADRQRAECGDDRAIVAAPCNHRSGGRDAQRRAA